MALFSGFVGYYPLERHRMATFEPEEFKEIMETVKKDEPLLFCFITDFVNKEVTKEEVNDFCSWSAEERQAHLEKRYGENNGKQK